LAETIEETKTKRRRGCRTALIVFGIVVLLLIVVGYFTCPRLAKFALEKSFSALEEGLVEKLPEGYDEQEVRDLLHEVKQGIVDGRISGEQAGPKIQAAATYVQSALSDDELTPEETDEILKRLRELAELGR
jgi:hypothetical protein